MPKKKNEEIVESAAAAARPHAAARTRPLEVVRVAIDLLKPDPKNARTHSKRNLQIIQSSLRRFGQQKPIVCSEDYTVRAGNGQLAAAKALGWKEIDIVRTDLKGADLDAYAIADNQASEHASWDETNLAEMMRALTEQDLTLALDAGFNEAEVNRIVNEAFGDKEEGPEAQIELAEELAKKWGCDLNQEWQFNSKTCPGQHHKLIIGDSTDARLMTPILEAFQPAVMVTDPPYGVQYDPEWRENGKNHAGVHGQKPTRSIVVTNDDQVDWSAAWRLFPGPVAYVWHGGVSAAIVAAALEKIGFEIRAQIIWKKQAFPISRGHYHWGHEPCWYAVQKGEKASWCGDRQQSTVWEIQAFHGKALPKERIEVADFHTTQKPVETFARPMRNHFDRGCHVYDPFAGSGTCFVAAENTGRVCLGVEISKQFAAVIIERASQMGLEPVKLKDHFNPPLPEQSAN